MVTQVLLIFAFMFAVVAALITERIDRPLFGIHYHFGWLAILCWLASIVFGK